jgi:hypothetical protein
LSGVVCVVHQFSFLCCGYVLSVFAVHLVSNVTCGFLNDQLVFSDVFLHGDKKSNKYITKHYNEIIYSYLFNIKSNKYIIKHYNEIIYSFLFNIKSNKYIIKHYNEIIYYIILMPGFFLLQVKVLKKLQRDYINNSDFNEETICKYSTGVAVLCKWYLML